MTTPTPAPNPFLKGNSGGSGSTGASGNPFLKKAAPVKTGASSAAKQSSTPLSFGQQLLNVLGTPMYFVEGAVNQSIKDVQKGDFLKALTSTITPIAVAGLFTGGASSKGVENVKNAFEGKKTIMGSDVLETAGWKDAGFWPGLVADIALDPLTYTPGAVVSVPLKAVAKAGVTAARAANVASKGFAVGGRAAGRAVEGAAAVKLNQPKTFLRSGFTEVSANAGGKVLAEARPGFVKEGITAERVGARGTAQALTDVAHAAAIGAWKGAKLGWKQGVTTEVLRGIAKDMARASKKNPTPNELKTIPTSLGALSGFVEESLAKQAEKAAAPVAEATAKVAAPAAETLPKVAEQVVEEATPAADNTIAAVLDKPFTPAEMSIMVNKTGASIKDAQKRLKAADKVAKGAEVAARDAKGISKQVIGLIQSASNARRVFTADIAAKVSLNNAADLQSVFKAMETTPIADIQKARNELLKREWQTASGETRTIADAIKGDLKTLNKADFAAVRKALTSFVDVMSKPANLSKMIAARVSELVGEKMASELKATGALGGKVDDETLGAVSAILKNVQGAAGKKYANADEMVMGIINGDAIAPEAIVNLLKALDPEHKLVKQAEEAALSDDSVKAVAILLGKEGRATIAAVQRRIEQQTSQTLLSSKKVAFGDAISFEIDRAAMGEKTELEAVKRASRDQAAREATGWITSPEAKVRELATSVIDSISRGLGTQYKNIIDVINDGAETSDNIFGVAAVRLVGKDGKVEKAFLPGVFSQYIGTKIWGSFASKGTTAEKWAKSAAKKKHEIYVAKDRMEDIAKKYTVMRDLVLGSFGVRPVYVRSVKDAGRKVENEYYAYVDMGDFAKLVAEAGNVPGAMAARRAFFPVDMGMKGVTDRAKNTLSPQSIERAIVNHLESLDAGVTYTREQMVQDIQFMPQGRESLWAKPFKDAVPGFAEDIADFIIANGENFANIHKARLMAEIQDSTRSAKIMSADIFNQLLEAARIAAAKGTMSDSKRVEMAATAWHKFSIATEAFAIENGPAAAAVMRATALMFIKLSGVDDIVRAAGKAGNDASIHARYLKAATLTRTNKELTKEYRDLVVGMNTVRVSRDKTAEIMSATPSGTLRDIETNLTKHMSAFEEVAKRGALGFKDAAALSAWKKEMASVTRKLENVRKKAIASFIPTKHWSAIKAALSEDGLGWVDSAAFNLKKEEAFVKNLGKTVTLDVAKPAPKKAASKAEGVKRKARATKVNMETVETQIQQTADDLSDAAEQVKQMHPNDTNAQAVRLIEEEMTSVARDAAIQADLGDNILTYAVTYQEFKAFYKNTRLPVKKGNYSKESLSFIQRMGDKVSIFGEKGLSMGMYRAQEDAVLRSVSDVTDTLRLAWHGFNKAGLTEADFQKAYTAARKMAHGDVVDIPEGPMGDAIKALYQTMDSVTAKMKAFSIDAGMLQRMLAKQGITERNGFQRVNELEDVGDLWDLFDNMPFMEKPEFDLTTEAGKEAAIKWEQRNADYMKRYESGDADGAFTSLSKVMAAIQFTVMQQSLALEAVARFNYKAEGLTLEQARARGYVTLKGTGNGFALTDLMPTTAAEGNLFHPDVARSLAFVNREYNRTFNGARLPKWIQGTIEVTQMLKSTQTVLRPGHLATTIVGDYSLAFMVNDFNLRDWATAIRISKAAAVRNIKADYASLGTMQDSINRMVASVGGVGGREMTEAAESKYSMLLGTSRKNVSDEDLVNFFTDNGVLTGNMQVNEAAMLDLEIAARAGGRSVDTEGNDVILETIKNGNARNKAMLLHQRIVKAPGDVVAYTSNIPRLVTALRVMREGRFNSLQDAMNAAADEVRLYHPTMDSLTATERKGPRLFFSYYTWLKTAHIAMFQMTMNHTAAMLLPSKALTNLGRENEMEGSYSLGNMWGDKSKTPGYLDYSTYGPTMNGPRGPMLWKPSILQLDVLDTWKFANDPTMTADQNLWANVTSAGRTLGSNMNMVAQPMLQLATGTNISTGKPEPIQNTQQFADKYVQLLGFTQALKGLGIYTPYNKIDNTTNPLTQRDRDLSGLNYVFGQRFADTQKPSDIKNARMEEAAKRKRIAEAIAEQMNQGK